VRKQNPHASISRREFLSLTGTSIVSSAIVPALRNDSPPVIPVPPLPSPKFYWGVGIENCWIAQTNPKKDGRRRLLDVFLQTQHYYKWKSDLDLARQVGFNAIRYSVPWYKAEPKPGIYDWSWIDAPVEYLVNGLKIIPIMDLIHYGTPAWMEDGVADPRFPDAIGRYAAAMASHFKGMVNHYSPHNEPGLTCILCGLNGRWPPYQSDVRSWGTIGVAVAKGMVFEMQAIRNVCPAAVIVSIDPYFYTAVDGFLPKAGTEDARYKELRRAAAVYPASLAYGNVQPGHPLAEFLVEHGVASAEIEWFTRNSSKPDIVGYNSYPDVGLDARHADSTLQGKLPLEQAARSAAAKVAGGLRETQAYFGRPVYLTETSAGLTTEAKIAYIKALRGMVRDFRQQGFPLVGINWWPLFQSLQWDYRENPDKPLRDFLYPGGWNNGLWLLDPQPDGDLRRVPTAAVDAYFEMLRQDADH
jgi:beta-glucosidase